jgi:hypothetical protein
MRIAMLALALSLSACTLLANGSITRTGQTTMPRNAGEGRLVIEDLGNSMHRTPGLLEIHTPVDGRAAQIVLSYADPQRPCFAIEDYLPYDPLLSLVNPYGRMDFALERSDGTPIKKYERTHVEDERFDVEYVVRGEADQGYVPQTVRANLVHAKATVCFKADAPVVTASTEWLRLKAGVSKYTYYLR